MWHRKRRLWLIGPLVLVLMYCVAIYCLPFVEFEPQVPEAPPDIPFNYREGPLRPSTASQFRVQHLFRGQISGAESMALDAQANAYLAIEGGLVLYAHLNKSSPYKTHYLLSSGGAGQQAHFGPELIKIAELNGVKQVSRQQQQQQQPNLRQQRNSDSAGQLYYQEASSTWRRECQLDEQLYGSQLYSPSNGALLGSSQRASVSDSAAWYAEARAQHTGASSQRFVTRVKVSRCSKPLGTRLSPDEAFLYVIDTLSGLYKVHLRVPERKNSNQRLVTRLLDFRANNWRQTLAAIQLDTLQLTESPMRIARLLNVSLRAVDDLAIDFGAGTRAGDLIYMSVASQQWPAVGYVYDVLEGRPSGRIVRFDTGNSQLVVLEPSQLAHVRTSGAGLQLIEGAGRDTGGAPVGSGDMQQQQQQQQSPPTLHYGQPRLDENDVFDDRPLHFPNGLELTDDKQALLVVDTANKRILKHHIRGPRRGTTDLWAYTPNFPDNIRRGYDKRLETYWVVGCARDPAKAAARDVFAMLRTWPVVKKFAVKNVYFFGWLIETLGQYVMLSEIIRDYGYQLKTGSSLCQNGCETMMVLQFNQNGQLLRSIYSREFPNDLKYYSQVNEIIDAQSQEHALYLSSPGYDYVTKLVLPTESYPSLASSPYATTPPNE